MFKMYTNFPQSQPSQCMIGYEFGQNTQLTADRIFISKMLMRHKVCASFRYRELVPGFNSWGIICQCVLYIPDRPMAGQNTTGQGLQPEHVLTQ